MTESASVVFLLRHAHAAAGEPNGSDYERPLDERGRRETLQMGAVFADRGWRPQRIVCSGSQRTRQTLEGLGMDLSGVETIFEDALYSGGRDGYLAALHAADASASVLLVGHNPMVAEFVSALVGDGDALALHQMGQGFPTGSLARIEFGKAPGAVAERDGYLSDFVVPER